MKVVVYAICKNERAFADRWMASMSEADEVYVLDTGSTDGTVEALRRRGARVAVEAITPWRFDVARNRSLDLVGEDADICVCTDLDEVLRPGWRAALERSWTPDATQASYRYTWSFNADGTEGVVFWQEKIHARRGYRCKAISRPTCRVSRAVSSCRRSQSSVTPRPAPPPPPCRAP